MAALISFLLSDRWRAACLIVLALLGVQTVRIDGLWPVTGLRHRLAASQLQVGREVAAHRQTKANYRAAQALARQQEAARLLRVRGEQERISDRDEADYNHRLAAARAAYARLRAAGGAGADPAPGGQPVPGLAHAPGGADAAPGGDGFSLDRRMIATQQALQLDVLIGWIAAQAAVPVNDAPVDGQVDARVDGEDAR